MTIVQIISQVEELKPQHQRDLLVWGTILIVAVVIGAFIIMLIKRWLGQPQASAAADAGFSLSELRAMRDRGEITPEEYENTRARVISKVKSQSATPAPPRARTTDGLIMPGEDEGSGKQ